MEIGEEACFEAEDTECGVRILQSGIAGGNKSPAAACKKRWNAYLS